ncbi:MAG: hypothetical protein ACOYY3_15365 [Chloroflexota bacterium]
MDKSRNEPKSLTEQEGQRLRANFVRLMDCLLNKIFALTRNTARARQTVTWFLLFFLGFLIGLKITNLATWLQYIREVFTALFQLSYTAFGGAVAKLITTIFNTFFAPETLRYLPPLLLPFLLAWQFAAMYLADIFELTHAGIARSFIMRAAFGARYERIHIREGQIAEEDRDSPVYQIGGPGLVQIELDSAALFEDADGRPRVQGPTNDQPSGFLELTGFERLRAAYDLRNHYTDSLTVNNRSLDGIKIEAKDVRLVYSVWRGPGSPAPTLERPHPFHPQAIATLTYNQACKVAEAGKPSACGPWHPAMTGIIRGELSRFIAEHRLVEFLASVNMPERQRAMEHLNILAGRVEQLAETDVDLPREEEQIPIPEHLTTRPEISNMFVRFVEDFNLIPSRFAESAQRRGLELHWIGIGAWHPPDEVVAEQHLEAWKLNRENVSRGAERAMNGLSNEAFLQEMMRLVHEVPFESLRRARARFQRSNDFVRQVVLDYRELIREALRRIRANAERQRNVNRF